MSPFGSFAEGVASGIKGGTENYIQGMMKKIDAKEQKDIAQSKIDQDVFSDKNMPLALRKVAWKRWVGTNKDWNTGFEVSGDLPDYIWEDKRFGEYQQRLLKIRNSKNYGLPQKIEAAKALFEEATNILGKEMAAPLKGGVDELQRKALISGVGKLGSKLSPETTNLLSFTETGKDIIKQHAKPIKPEKETPHCFRLGNDYYVYKGGKSKLIQKGSPEQQAWMNTMREPMYSYWSSTQQWESYKKHLAFLRGTPQLAPIVSKEPAVKDKPGFASEVFNRFFPKQAEEYGDNRTPLMKPRTIIRPVAPGTKLTKEMAKKIWEASGHNKELAGKMAKEKGYSITIK